MTTSRKDALANHRRRARSRGMVRVEVTARRDDVPLLRRIAGALREKTGAASRVRSALRTIVAPADGTTLMDLIASDLPDEAFAPILERDRSPPRRSRL